MNYKIVEWADFAIPVPLWANWMAWDYDGSVWVYHDEPDSYKTCKFFDVIDEGKMHQIIRLDLSVSPPEQGPWYTQLYWIG